MITKTKGFSVQRCSAYKPKLSILIMKQLIILLASFGLLVSCNDKKQPDTPYKEVATVLTVTGMHCSNCEGSIMTALSKVEGVEWARAENELEEVAYTGVANREVVAAAIREAGFEVP